MSALTGVPIPEDMELCNGCTDQDSDNTYSDNTDKRVVRGVRHRPFRPNPITVQCKSVDSVVRVTRVVNSCLPSSLLWRSVRTVTNNCLAMSGESQSRHVGTGNMGGQVIRTAVSNQPNARNVRLEASNCP